MIANIGKMLKRMVGLTQAPAPDKWAGYEQVDPDWGEKPVSRRKRHVSLGGCFGKCKRLPAVELVNHDRHVEYREKRRRFILFIKNKEAA